MTYRWKRSRFNSPSSMMSTFAGPAPSRDPVPLRGRSPAWGEITGRRQPEGGSPSIRAADPDISPVAGDDPVDDARPQPLTDLLGGEKGLEDPFPDLFAHPDPRVRHLQEEMVPLVDGRKLDLASPGHRFHGIDDEVAGDAADLGGFAHRDGKGARPEVNPDADSSGLALVLPLGPGHLDGVGHDRVQVERPAGSLLAGAGKILDPAGRFRALARGLFDRFHLPAGG